MTISHGEYLSLLHLSAKTCFRKLEFCQIHKEGKQCLDNTVMSFRLSLHDLDYAKENIILGKASLFV